MLPLSTVLFPITYRLNRLRWVSIIVSLILTLGGLAAQDITNYNVDDGLPSPEVYDIEFDHTGKLWLTTDRGVASYDGYSFTTYSKLDGLGDVVNFEIIKIDSTLWFTGWTSPT